MSKHTTEQITAAAAFLAAFTAFQGNRDRNAYAALNAALDTAINAYRKAHGLADCNGLLDCVNHYNRTHATA